MERKKGLNIPVKGMQRNLASSKIDEQTYTYALNTNNESKTGDKLDLTFEMSNHVSIVFPTNYKAIGYKKDLLSNRTYYFLTNPETGYSSFGYTEDSEVIILPEDTTVECEDCKSYGEIATPLEDQVQVPNQTYVELLNDLCNKDFNFDINNPIYYIIIKTEKLGTNIYFTDDRNPDRVINVDEIDEYKFYGEIICGEDLRTPVCVNVEKMLAQPNYTIPEIQPEKLEIGGNLKLGTYSFTVAYCDAAGNEISEYCTPTNPISLFDENNYNLEQQELNSLTNFAIRLKVENLDLRFRHYKVVVIERVNLANAEAYYEEGIHPTTDDTIFYTTSSTITENNVTGDVVNPRKRTTLENILSVRPRYDRIRILTSSNNYLFKSGLTAKKEINLQPVFNLMGAFLQWHSSVAKEALYKSPIATSKYKGYMRDEVQPFAARMLFNDGTYSPNFPLVARPASTFLYNDEQVSELAEVEPTDFNYQSITANSPNCSANSRTRIWQIYNTATVEGACDDFTENGTIITENDVQQVCTISDVSTFTGLQTSGSLITGQDYIIYILNGGDDFTNVGYLTPGVAFTATGTTPTTWTNGTEVRRALVINVDGAYTNLKDYINENLIEIQDPTSPLYIEEIADYLSDPYTGQNCDPPYNGNCDNITLIDEYNSIGDVDNDQADFIPKLESNYTRSKYPAPCLMFSPIAGTIVDGNEQGLDTFFMAIYMGCLAKAYKRQGNFDNEDCGYAPDVFNNNDPSMSGIGYYNNYYGGDTAADLFLNDYDTTCTDANYYNKLHKGALWFRINRNQREEMVFEITKTSICTLTDQISNVPKLRYTFYENCSPGTPISNVNTLGCEIFDPSVGVLRVITDFTNFPDDYFYVAIDAPITNTFGLTNTDEFEDCPIPPSGYTERYRTAPICGCYSVYTRDTEYSGATVSFNEISFNKTQTYEADCQYILPKVSDCDPIPYQYGKSAYWESEETYPDNLELYDSSNLVIAPEDIEGLSDVQKEQFEEYFTSGVTAGNYNLLAETNLACQPIRHFKFPDNIVSSFMNTQNTLPFSESLIFPLGVHLDSSVVRVFLDIALKNNLITQKQKDSIVGFEIMRGDNSIHKSIISNALAYDMFAYLDGSRVTFYPNYPHNDLGIDQLHLTAPGASPIPHPNSANYNTKFSLISPEFAFSKPALPTEMSVSGYQFGNSRGYFYEVDEHSKMTILTSKAKDLALQLAIAEQALEVAYKAADLTVNGIGQTFIQAGFVVGTNAIGVAISAIALAAYLTAEGINSFAKVGQFSLQWQKTFRDLGSPKNFASAFVSEGYQNRFFKNDSQEDYLRGLSVRKYLRDGRFTTTDEKNGERYQINNFRREDSVFVSTGQTSVAYNRINYPLAYKNYDNNTKGSTVGSRLVASQANCPFGTSGEVVRNVASPYVTLKNYVPSQYGNIDSIKWLTTNYKADILGNSCEIAYGGTVCISRFTWKRKMSIFSNNALNTATKVPFSYTDYPNVGFPVYFINYESDDEDKSIVGELFPDLNTNFILDCYNTSTFYVKKPSKFYLYYYGIANFLTESEINCNFRYSNKEAKDQFWPNAGDMIDFTQEKNVSIREPNTFRYNTAYSMPVINTPFKTLDRTYSKEVWDKRNDAPNGTIYSLQDNSENDLVDPWRIFRPLDRYEFPTKYGRLIDLKDLESAQILARFDNQMVIFNAVDNLASELSPVAVEIGTGGIFSKRPLEFKATDLGYSGTQTREMVSTPYGHFTVDAKRGGIFQLDQNAKQLQPISDMINNEDSGMKNWFREHLPFKLLKQFPQINIDNKFKGIGISMGWDARFERVFITKRDYRALDTENLKYSDDIGFYIDPDVFTCGSGFDYNPDSGMCERSIVTQMCPDGYTYVDGDCILDDDTISAEVCDPACTIVPELDGNANCVCLEQEDPTILKPHIPIYFDNTDYFEDLSWTVSYKPLEGQWNSYFSFKPDYYIAHQNYFQVGVNYSAFNTDEGKVWSHLLVNSYGVFFGRKYPWIIEYLQKTELVPGILNDIYFNLTARRYTNNLWDYSQERNVGFNNMTIYNNTNNSGRLNLFPQNKFNRRENFPRKNGNTQDILYTDLDNRHHINYFYNRVKNQDNRLPIWLNDRNMIEKTLNSNAISFTGKSVLERMRGDYFYVRLEQNAETRYKFNFTFSIQDKTNY